MKILLTGVAGFIGFHLAAKLAQDGYEVVGIDSINEYYEIQLKRDRLKELGITATDPAYGKLITSERYPNFQFIKADLNDAETLEQLFAGGHVNVVCNLAAQPGVRYSITNPKAYIESNITGFFNLINAANQHKVDLFVYASSSSVYGDSKEIPFNIGSDTNHPVSFYAATKKTNELLAHTYSHVFNMKTIGVRFFTVYGPWGRPDMAYFSFTRNILEGKPINLYNNGQLKRDFTYIDDIVEGMKRIITNGAVNMKEPYKLYNIGNHDPVTLDRFVKAIETALQKKAIVNYLPMQPGDVEMTYADISDIQRDYDFTPSTSIEAGMQQFTDWYRSYYKQ
jgi:UDP-glucuronate 4-epimerase